MELTEQQRNTYLRRISHILLINGGFMDNPGLYTGEMGLALFFFRYAHYTQNGLFAQYGFDLVDKAQSRIHAGTPIDYKQGLTGLGSVLEYLVQCGYIKADTDAILEEFDRKLFDLENLPSLSLEDLFGIGYYALWRMTGASKLKYRILKTVLPALVSSMVEKNKNFSSSCPTVRVIKELIETENLKGLKTNTPLPASLRLCRHAYPYGLAEPQVSHLLLAISDRG